MGKSGDTECPAVSLSLVKARNLWKKEKNRYDPEMVQVQVAMSWLLWPMKVQLCIKQSLHVPEVQQGKDDVQTSLPCVFCVATKPL